MTMTAFAFDESRVHRDRDGQFDDGIPGPSVKADRLKLAGRISLGSGESLHSSDRVAANGGGSALVAAVDGNAGRQVRLGAIADDKGAEKWRAANRGATANLNDSEARQTSAVLETVVRRARDQALEAEIVGDALDDLDPDSPRFDELTARHEALTSGLLTGEQTVQSSWGDVAMGYSVDDVGIIRVVVGVRPDDSQPGWSLQDAWSNGDAVEMTPAQASRLARKVATAAGPGAQTAAVNGMDEFAIPDQLADYWLHGKGAAKVRWCTRGSWRRARRLLRKYVNPAQLDGLVTNLYVRACGHGPRRGNAASAFAADTMQVPTEDAPRLEVAEEGATGVGYRRVDWSGPLAPIDIATGDRREFAEDALSTRQLPLPFRWQEKAASGHDGAVVVGSLTGYDIRDDGTIWGRGYFLDPEVIPDVRKAMHLVEHGVVGPSVDLEPDMDVMPVDENGEEFDPEQCQMDGDCPDKPRARITRATIAGATLVPITAFAEARAPQLTQSGHDQFCLWPLHPGPCKESGSGGGGGSSAGKKTGTDTGKKKTSAPAAEQTPAQAPARGVVAALLREKFLDTPQTVNNDTTPEDRQADAELVAEQALVQQRREQRAKVRAQAQQARDRYGPRSKWPKRVKANVEREEQRVSQLAAVDVHDGCCPHEFCRNPLHPGPCKGWRRGGSKTPDVTPSKPSAKSKPAPKPAPAAKTPAASKPSATGKATTAVKPKVMEADWKDHNDSLTKEQQDAVHEYTTSGYFAINNALKGTPPKTARERKAVEKATGLIRSSMAPAPRATKVFRGTNTASVGLSKNPTLAEMQALVGKTLVNDAFTSTSVDAGEIFGGNLEFDIDMPEGTPSLWLNGNSRLPDEHEVLLDAGSRMQVLSVRESPAGSGNFKVKTRITP